MKNFIFVALITFGAVAAAQDAPEPKLDRVDAAQVFSMTTTERLAFEAVNRSQAELNRAQVALDATIAALISDVKARIGAKELGRSGDRWVKLK